MQHSKKYLLAFIASLMIGVMGVSGCEQEGPAEEAGEAVDEAAEDAKRKVEDATD